MTATTGANIRPAASLLMLRDGPRGTEVLLMRRPERGDNDFRSGMCVFPGGVLDRADAQAHAWCFGLDDATASARLGLPHGGLDYFVAALRESFEEVGLLFACGPAGEPLDLATHADTLRDWRSRLHRGDATIASLCQAMGWRLDLRDMAYFAHWLTPVVRPKRFDTRFFVRVAPAGQQALPDMGEALELLWLTPDEALDPARGLKLLNVTQKVLHSIRSFENAQAGFQQALGLRGVRRVFPRMALGRGGPRFVIDGEAAYAEVARLDPDGRGDARCELTPGDVTQLSPRLWRVCGADGNAYLVADTHRSAVAIIDAHADDTVQLQALLGLGVAPVRQLLVTRMQDARIEALRAHWPLAQGAPAPAAGQVLQIGSDSHLRIGAFGIEHLGYLIEEEGIALGQASSFETTGRDLGIEWLAPRQGFMQRLADG